MAHEFDAAIAHTPGPDGRYDVRLDEGWHIGGGVNGGILLSTLAHAIGTQLPAKPDPLVVSAHYLGASVPGEATVSTRVIREGGTVATAEATLHQDGREKIAVLATYGDLGRLDGEVRTPVEPVAMPDPDQCIPADMAPGRTPPLMDRFDLRFDPATIGWALGEPSGEGEIRAWMRLKDGREPDPLVLLTIVDALPPVVFDLGYRGWAPTLELTAHVRARPAPGWLRVRAWTTNVAGGLFEEDCEVWDSTGRLVAQSRQLAMTPRG
ncbi:thioesterase family protein [Nocardioides campestrisoli]|uniref:thioesterase family protein n=1 Tax=Nocardioides campestrisoli TaxID=2736757 RepID=UPI0015E7DE7D|nr:thioesterase family protein [Nocardioides campestrisoli]